jgi:hypothetical protein
VTPAVVQGRAAVRGWDACAIELKERAFADCERGGLPAEAAELARGLAFLQVSVHGNRAVAMRRWRAEGVLEGVLKCAAHGWLFASTGADLPQGVRDA